MKYLFSPHMLIGLLTLSNLACAQTPLAANQIKVGVKTITWVQTGPSTVGSSASKTIKSSPSNNKSLGTLNGAAGMDFSRIPNGFLGIGQDAASKQYGFISEEVVVILKPGEANKLATLNASCMLIVENARMYVCKAASVPHLQSLMGQLQVMPSVKEASPQFVTQFDQPM